jgi:hypothetical protein
MTTQLEREFKRRLTVYDIDDILTFTKECIMFEKAGEEVPKKIKQLEKPIKRKLEIMGKEFIVVLNRLGILFRQKGSRNNGVLLEWDKAKDRSENGVLTWTIAFMKVQGIGKWKSGIKVTRTGRILAERY